MLIFLFVPLHAITPCHKGMVREIPSDEVFPTRRKSQKELLINMKKLCFIQP